MNIKKSIKYLLILMASVLASVATCIFIGGFNLLCTEEHIAVSGVIQFIVLIVWLVVFLVLSKKHHNKYSIYTILVVVTTAILCLGIAYIDEGFTHNYAITNGWLDLFGWNKYDFGKEPMAHRVLGFILVIYPIVIILSSYLSYMFYLRKNKT